ncbi:MAG: NifU family protein, partial [Actinomycetota bacterium]|nr:NifU family protein [Actinomycetota bacterium]
HVPRQGQGAEEAPLPYRPARALTDLRAVGDRIEAVLAELRSSLDRRDRELVEEAVGLVTDLYGGGLERVLDLVSDEDVERLREDDLVGSLMILHGLHPLDLRARVLAALDSVRPYLGSHGGDVEVLGIDEEAGVLSLRMLGSCDGCPSSSVTLQRAVKEAVEAHAPEIVGIDVADETPSTTSVSTMVPLTRKPVAVP